jgi:uncharacterized membrane protein YgcG
MNLDVSSLEAGIILNIQLNILPQNMVEQMRIEFNLNQTGSVTSSSMGGTSSSSVTSSSGGSSSSGSGGY